MDKKDHKDGRGARVSMNVPFIDLQGQLRVIKNDVLGRMENVFERGNFILGEEVCAFEKDFAAYCDACYGVGVNSGTDALALALRALDVKPGDEVVLPAHTFIATALAVSYTGARPVFVDIDPETYGMDPQGFRRAVTSRTKAVIPVHLYGQPADMDEIAVIAREHDIKILEDAAQAHGAVYQDRRAGSLGDAACFSFYPTKNLGAFGDGGMIVTRDQACYEKLLMLRDYGRVGRYEHRIKGYNSRLDTVQAVVLAAKLQYLDEWNRMRLQAARWYAEELEGADGVALPVVKPDRTHVFHLFVARVQGRDRVMKHLQEKGIGALIHYPVPIHLQKAFEDAGYQQGDFPETEKAAREIVSLPMFPHIRREQVQAVCAALKAAVA